MAENVYEGMFIFDSNRYARDPAGASGQIEVMVKKCGGTMLASRLWEERRLAYPIGGQRKGTYWLAYFRLDSDQVATINRQCRLSEDILRALVLKVEPRIVDTLVSHAKAGAEVHRAKQAQAAEAEAAPAVAGAEGQPGQ